MRYAESVEEAVEQLKTAESIFLFASKGMGRSSTPPQEAWENFKLHCQQLSQWIEHGRGVTEEMKPDLVKTLFASEKILLEHTFQKKANRRFRHNTDKDQ